MNLLCDQLEPRMLWGYLGNLFTQELEVSGQLVLESVALIDNLVGILSLKDQEVQSYYVPYLTSTLIQGLEVRSYPIYSCLNVTTASRCNAKLHAIVTCIAARAQTDWKAAIYRRCWFLCTL